MRGRAVNLLRRGCANVAGHGEVASVSASIRTHTPDGYKAGLDFTVVFEFRGPEASSVAWEEDMNDSCRGSILHKVGRDRTAHFDPPLDHTWWPHQPHLCVLLSSLYGYAGADVLSSLSGLNTARAAVPGSAPHVADHVYEHIRYEGARGHLAKTVRDYGYNHPMDWGVLPVVVLARAWPICDSYDDEFWATWYESRLPRFPWLASRNVPWTVGGLPDLADPEALRDFNDLVRHRDAALKSAVVRGFHPYSYDGVRIMSRSLRRAEEEWPSRAATVSGLKAMRRQLYESPYRI